jgi:fatty acid kinase fatty acid binding subunit
MSKIALVTDSTAYLPKDLLDKYKISVAPQILIWGKETFEDGVDILPAEFYSRLQKATVMPSSSQVTVSKFQEIFQRLLDQDCQVLTILIAAKLSGTINSAVQAKAMLPAGAPIEIIDSNTTAMAMGFQVLSVARAIDQGAGMVECVQLAQEATKHTGVFFAVDTLEFLHRGGRIGTGSRYLGTALNIKPILEVRDGAVEAVERVRTRRKSLSRIIELVSEHIKGQKPVRLATLHANAPEEARIVLDEANEKLSAIESIYSEVSPVIGTHAGPGTVGLAFMAGM